MADPAKSDSIVGQHQQLQCAHERVKAAVAKHVAAWAKIVALTRKDARFVCFREDVTWALDGCMRLHILGNQYRPSDFRKDLLAIRDAYIAAAEALRKAQAVRARCFPLPLRNEFQLGPLPTEHQLMARAEAARLDAEEWKQRHPPSMPAFNALTKDLVLAYRRATRRSGVGYGAREGELRAFVEGVLPVAREIAGVVTGKPLETPATADALGEYLHNVASAIKGRA
jgi:hypothetical protein